VTELFDSREWVQIRNALEFYANPHNWREDDWGVVGVIAPPGYGRPTVKAKRALDALARLREQVEK